MKIGQAIKQTVHSLIDEKRGQGDVPPYATSVEVAHLLGINALEVERIAKNVDGLEIVKIENHEIYYEV